MNSKYIQDLEEEIKKTKAENELQLKLAKLKIDKMNKKEKLKLEKSQSKDEKEFNNILQKKDLNNILENLNNIETNENNNKNDSNELNDDKDELNNKDEKNIKYSHNKKIKEKNYKNNFEKVSSLNICQCCNQEFDLNKKIPFMLKCKHIFCKKCLENYFTNEKGIKCPIDGIMGESFNDIKILNIFPKNNNNNKIKRNHINFGFNYKSKSYKELIRNKPKKKNNSLTTNTYEKIKSYIINDNNLKNSRLSNTKRKSFSKKFLTHNNIHRPLNKASSFIGNNNISISQFNQTKNFSKSNLNEEYNEENNENSEYVDDNDIQNFCKIHPDQKITHFVEDTKELICIHCAFNKLKKNQNIQIKEIPEKCKEYLNDLNIIIENNQKCMQIIENSLNDISETKEKEELNLIEIYEQILNILVNNRNNYLIKIEEIYQENSINMNKKLEKYAEIIDIAGKLKEDFETINDKAPYEFNNLTQAFNKFIRDINDKNNSDLEINQFNFSHDELNKVIRYLNDFADVKTKKKIYRFDLLKNSKNNINVEEINNTNSNYNNNSIKNLNLYKSDINNYFKNNKEINFVNKKLSNNKINNMNFRNSLNNLELKNSSQLQKTNNNFRFSWKYEEQKRDNFSDIFNNYNQFNNNKESKNNSNGSISESINDTLRKYIASTNMIRDNLYNQAPIVDLKNSKNGANIFDKNKNKMIKESLFNNDKIEMLNKYKIPTKKIKRFKL